jgi:hypothetical protein
LGGMMCISTFLVSSCVLSTIHPPTGSHAAHSWMTTTKWVIGIVLIVTLVNKTHNKKMANCKLHVFRRRAHWASKQDSKACHW